MRQAQVNADTAADSSSRSVLAADGQRDWASAAAGRRSLPRHEHRVLQLDLSEARVLRRARHSQQQASHRDLSGHVQGLRSHSRDQERSAHHQEDRAAASDPEAGSAWRSARPSSAHTRPDSRGLLVQGHQH